MSALGRRFFGGIVAVLAGLALAFQFPTAAYAADLAIDLTNFPDTNFRNYVSTTFDTNNDGTLQQLEADAVTAINVRAKSITNLKGVEHFTNLSTLYASHNQLTDIDVSHNTNLTSLGLSENRLTAVDLSHNTNLRDLDLSGNQLTDIDVSANTNLTELYSGSNQLTAVDLSANTNLRDLDLNGNQLTAIDLSANTKLEYLYLTSNQLTAIDLSHNTNLTYLLLANNQLTAIDLSANTQLGSSSIGQSRAVRVPESSRLVPVNQLSAGFDAGKVRGLEGATIVDGQLKVNEGVSEVTYGYATDNDTDPLMPVTLQVAVAPVYTVSFDMGGHGAQVAAQSVEEGEQASAPAAPSAEGWKFKGWYTDNTFATAFDFTAPITADVTVYAKWEKAAGGSTTGSTGKSTTKPTGTVNKVTPEGTAITGADASWFALLGAAFITAGGLLLLRRRT